ncbi:CRISPR system precrRNA processing endoribonuclease RAMP protein Cas6 [Halorhodospira halochloris]|uniref:CRISPR system precrRNA processing endoribonuclease RAMP protein Cas6 n=1 Tax=Halorhodospira halochloris TaxID=1052 RepID=UPI001A926507|nr:CRISPR system precrRNA processing endoribonuclease RAMP protein Cas6 [Halorhodospira halochloris]
MPLRLHYRAEQQVKLPFFPGSIWRSALGYRLRRASCVTGAERCDGCLAATHCAYGQLFETPTQAVTARTHPYSEEVSAEKLLKNYPKAPHPFVLSPVSPGGEYSAGSEIEVELILLNPALRWMPTLLPVLHNLQLKRSKLKLQRISLVNTDGLAASGADNKINVTAEELLKINELATPQHPPHPPEFITIRVQQHPLRLRRKNRYVGSEQFDPGVFISALLRRASMLNSITSQATETDFRYLTQLGRSIGLNRSELHWFDWHRHSTPQDRRVPMGGLLGEFQLDSVPEEIWPWVWLGQWLHVGKGAVMGMGRYQLAEYAADN